MNDLDHPTGARIDIDGNHRWNEIVNTGNGRCSFDQFDGCWFDGWNPIDWWYLSHHVICLSYMRRIRIARQRSLIKRKGTKL